jgi:hypothetical protein
MYFWKIDSLTQDLKNGAVPQSERFKYLLATVIAYAAVIELTFLFVEPITTLQTVQAVAVIALTIGGTIYCYLLNARGDNQEFIDRFVCIGWVVSVRVTVLFIAVFSLYMFTGYTVGGEAFEQFSERANFVDVSFTLLMCGLCYRLIGKHIRKVAR